ncbi:type II toxin-antitoxin system HicA family toxin [Candidatus Thiosymbion oneisti]|uniref:type II toxin-antitoxin system HicA family toxin n=1 Tax=Candidatus Thiosymbion oneisti TaxID=589554 RepID=UPI000B7F604A|nr:type II toxin-antitoxin system HicA family toxin [Candidatus Thiosymbion oneisti]
MKRKKFVRSLERQGCFLLRHRSNHDIYMNAKNGSKQPVPRHSEIDDQLAKHIQRYLGL